MGSWLTSIAQGAGRLGSELGQSTDYNLELALKTIQNKLTQQSIEEGQQRIAAQKQAMQIQAAPRPEFFGTPTGGTSEIDVNPLTGVAGPSKSVIEGRSQAVPPELSDQNIDAIAQGIPDGPRRLAYVSAVKSAVTQGRLTGDYSAAIRELNSIAASEANKPSEFQQKRAQAEKDVSALYPNLVKGSPQWTKKVDELTNPSGSKVTFSLGSAGGAGGGNEIADYAAALAKGEATLSQVPAKQRGAVLDYMRKNGMSPQRKFNAVEQRQQDAIVTMEPMLDSLQTLLESPQPSGGTLKNDNSPFASRYEWFKYNTAKIAPDGIRGDLIRQSAALQIMGAAPWVQIGRSKYTYENIIKHLPNPEDSPKLLYDKVKFLRQVLADQQKSLDKAKGGSLGSQGGGTEDNPLGLNLSR